MIDMSKMTQQQRHAILAELPFFDPPAQVQQAVADPEPVKPAEATKIPQFVKRGPGRPRKTR